MLGPIKKYLLNKGGKMSNALSIFNQLRPVTVGYDNIFDHFEKMFEDDFFKSPSVIMPNNFLLSAVYK